MSIEPSEIARRSDAILAHSAGISEDMYASPHILEPPLDPRLAADWKIVRYITGIDALFRPLGSIAPGTQRVFYGMVLQSLRLTGVYMTVVRGTAGIIEWLEDAEFMPMAAHGGLPGVQESGFVGIYRTFTAHPPGAPQGASPVVDTLAALLTTPPGIARMTVVGHSLGAALATYLAYEVALKAPRRVALRAFASPHPGDAAFSRAVAAAIPDHQHYANTADLVPHVPLGLGYCHLPNTQLLRPVSPFGKIRLNLLCLHHAFCYSFLLDPHIVSAPVPVREQPYRSCITVTS